jgi:8-oxo-dGTP diphosphatase
MPGELLASTMIEFGNRIDSVSYIDRPGAYAIVKDGANRIALVRTPKGYFLPGGGVDPNETVEQALRRELIEEIGYESKIEAKLGIAAQYLHAKDQNIYFRKVGHFFVVRLTDKVSTSDNSHELVWCPLDESLEKLAQEFQAWGVRQAFIATPQRD